MVSKGCRLEDDGTDFDKDNEVTILMPSFIDFFFFFFLRVTCVYNVNV